MARPSNSVRSGRMRDPGRRQMRVEPAQVVLLGDAGTEHEKAAAAGMGDGEIADQLAFIVQHRRQREPARARQPVREHALEPRGRTGARHFVLGEARRLEQPDRIAHGATLVADRAMRVGAAVRDVLDGVDVRRREPERVLEAERGAEHRSPRLQPVVHRRHPQRTRRRKFFVGEADAKAPRIVLAHLRVGVRHRRPVAEARHVHRPDVEARIAMDHPVRQREPDASALTEPRHHAARDPVIAEPADRTDDRIAVRRERERPVDDRA